MVARPSGIGPAGQHVGRTVAALRTARGLEQAELADMLAAAGWTTSHKILSRVEAGERRVDVDELVALAIALDVAPGLLLPPVRDEPDRELPPGSDPDDLGPVGAALADDIEALGDLVGMEPTLAATAVRLARQIDGWRPVPCDDCGSLVQVPADPRILPQLTRELRATVAALVEGRTVDDDDDDELGDLGTA